MILTKVSNINQQPMFRFLLLVLTTSLLFSCGQKQVSDSSQSSDTSSAEKIKDSNRNADEDYMTLAVGSVSDIKQVYGATMDQLQKGNLDSVAVEYNCNNERSGTVTYYSQKGILTMIQHSYAEYDHHSTTDQYFVQDDKVYFIYSNDASWNFVSAEITQDHFTENRTYVIEDESVLCLEKKYNILSNAPTQRLDETDNTEIVCAPIQPILTDFEQLVAFRNQPNQDCFGK